MNVDVEALTLVVRNLVHNALKFTRRTRAARILIAARKREECVELVVRDNGIGFDMQYHEQIFGLFHRLHREDQYPGTGIGLALVRKALERMHGSVRAESREGEGATFVVRQRG
jgi:light-regulated signal transduction histidine kinase (bacteriophytochrome)